MLQYTLRRMLIMVPFVWAGITLVFVLLRILPGDPAMMVLAGATEGGQFDPKVYNLVRERMGLNDPLVVQYGKWLRDFFTFHFGASLTSGGLVATVDVRDDILRRLPFTAEIAVVAMLITALFGIPIGILSAVRQDTWGDYLARFLSITALSMPTFWVGILIILGLVILFNWLPPVEWVNFWKDPLTNLSQLIWVALAVGLRQTAVVARMTRSTMLEVLREDFIRTARAKGLRGSTVIWLHALRNALLPVVTILGIELALLMGGLVVTEQVFNVPGLGMALARGVSELDYPTVQAVVGLVVIFVLVMNLLVDLLYAFLDPRVRYT